MEYPKAGFSVRLLAFLIDVIIINVVGFVVGTIPFIGTFLGFFVGAAYFTYFFGTTGQTLGKRALNLKVVSTDGSPMTYEKGFLRYIGYIISSIPVGLGYLWIIWDKNRQGFHDKLAKTYVIRLV